MPYIKGLDFLRFLGAVSVIALHLGSVELFSKAGLKGAHVLISGNTGVTLFYVISGFLITSIIMDEVNTKGDFSVWGFFRKRALRIFPLYYTALLAYFAVDAVGKQKLFDGSIIYAIFYGYNFVPRELYDGWLGSFHTLATEEHFYLLYPLTWYLALLFGRSLWPVLLATCLLTFATAELTSGFSDNFFPHRWTFNAWGPIMIGCLFGYFYTRSDRATYANSLQFVTCFVALYASQIVYFNSIIMAVGFGMLILHFAYNQERGSTAALGMPVFKFLGAISYGLYVWQSFIISTGPSRRLINDPAIATVAVFGLAVASWYLIERPCARLRSAKSMKPALA